MASLYKKRNTWYIDYFLGKKKISKNTHLIASEENRPKAEKLRKEIEKLLKEQHESEKDLGNKISKETTLNKAITMFADTYVVGRSQSHVENFNYVMRRFKSIVSGNTNVKDLKPEHVTQFVLQMKRELSQATQVTYFQYLASFLTYLKENEFITDVPIGKGIRPKKAIKNIISFDPNDLSRILDEAKKRDIRYFHAFMMFLLTGQRPGDVLRLQVRDIDFHRKIMYFRVSKTASEFKFPIYGNFEGFLREELKLSENSEKDTYLFPGLTVGAVGKAFRKIKKVLGLSRKHYYTLKTFRKNFATDMSKMGMTIQEVQALLDHKSPSTTLRYYADVRAEELLKKIDKLQSDNC